ncbi:hypothetical protein QKT49_gp213 [Acanthamoeba castellanii medusavirus]|uniref:Uncharacterized protein n=1 Tax=Acanthamoeba castellanii medusavirus J1 TaxID=3114988 RepID=A0A3T1CXI9_9VIRU|nr:hypothetical protein QKT49_gp213 [Acanthamoeba castellanii medusavirus]BBI30550.1 hypothetical protein [Acanthamoeba castellanii medusavirus J1]
MELSAAQTKYLIGGAVLVAVVVAAWLLMRSWRKAANDKASVWAKGADFTEPKADGSLHKAPNPQRLSGSPLTAKTLAGAKDRDGSPQSTVELPAVPAGGPLDHQGIVEQENVLHRYQSDAATDDAVEAYYINGAPY